MFDLAGRPVFLQDERAAAGTAWSYIRYDAISRPLETGTVTGFTASQLQLLADAGSLPAGAQWRVRYTHDDSATPNAAGCLTRARTPGPASGEDTWDFEYDARKRIVRKTVTLAGMAAPASISVNYDRLDRRTSLTYPDGRTVRFSYDAKGGLLSQVTLASPTRTLATFQRDAAGRLSSISGPGGFTTQWQYDAGGAVVSQMATSMNRTILSDVFEYDANGRMVARTSAGDGRWEFGRDSLSRLSSVRFVQESGAPQLRYHFGPSGEVDSTGGPLDSERGTLSGTRLRHLTRPPWGAEDLLYDTHGNTIRAVRSVGTDTLSRLELRFGDSGELRSVVGRTPDLVDSATYTYDPWMFRSRKTVKSTTTCFVRDENGDVLAELDSAGTMLRGYVRAEGRMLGVLEPGGKFVAYAVDVLGSVRIGVEESGAIRFSQQFLPFGELERFEGEERPLLGFLGAEQDWETGFCYLKARYYDPQQARFLSPDPLRDAGTESYAYGFGDPLTFADPSGLAAELPGLEIGLDDGMGNMGRFVTHTLPPIVIWGTRFQDTFLLTVAALHAIYGNQADLRFWRDAAEFVPGFRPGASGVGDAGGAGWDAADLVHRAREMVRTRLNLYRTAVSPLAARSVVRFLVVHEGAASLKVALALNRARGLTPAQLQSIRLRAGALLLAETTLDLGTLIAIQVHPSGRLAALVTAPLWTTAREEVSKFTDDALARIVPGYGGLSIMDAVFGPLPATAGP